MPRVISRLIRALVLIISGFFFVFQFNFFGAIGPIQVILFLIPLPIFGLIALIAGLLILFQKTRIAGYFGGIFVSGSVFIAAMLSLIFTPIPHSVVVFYTAVAAFSYLEGLAESIKEKYN